MKYIVDIPEGYLEEPFTVLVRSWGKEFKCYCLDPILFNEPDGCKGCKYDSQEAWEEPCRRCKNGYGLMWRAKE